MGVITRLKPPTKEILKKIRAMAEQGLKDYEIAAQLGMNKNTFSENKYNHPEILHALELGRADGVKVVATALYKKARKGDFQSMKFYLMNIGKWTDKAKFEHSGEGGGPIQHDVNWQVEIIDSLEHAEDAET